METEARTHPLVTLKSLQGKQASSPRLSPICMDFTSSGLPGQATFLPWDSQRSQEGVSPGQHPAFCQLLEAWPPVPSQLGYFRGSAAAAARELEPLRPEIPATCCVKTQETRVPAPTHPPTSPSSCKCWEDLESDHEVVQNTASWIFLETSCIWPQDETGDVTCDLSTC